MPLNPGRRLGPYEIVSPLGAGGMGEVYEARDTRLGRTVAIKVLPEGLAGDPERRARFEREARTVSQLTHAHICTLHDVGSEEGIHFLVMEHLEGETLAERLERGALPLDETLRHGAEIAEALDAAHRRGVVHRDLKPANVMLTREGVKLLDFGLARLAAGEAGELGDGPTMTMEARHDLTEEGAVLGTFPYMSPEQVEGGEADARSDIFALGAVLYEMATGRRSFDGDSAASIMAAVLKDQPEPLTKLQPVAPPALDHVVSRCLAKDPDRRWQTARDVAEELRWVAETGSDAGVAAPVARRRKSRERLAWASTALLAVVATVLAVLLLTHPQPAEAPGRIRFTLEPPAGHSFEELPALSPDGRRLAFVTVDDEDVERLWIRSLESVAPRPVPGVEGQRVEDPFWSPDGRSLGIFVDRELKRVDLDGGIQTLCSVDFPRGGTWSRDGVILFGWEPHDTLFRVSAAGGVPEPVPGLADGGERALAMWPHFLPDGDHFLFAAGRAEEGGIYAGSLSAGDRKLVVSAGTFPRVSRMAYDRAGYLLYVRVAERTLVAQPFDADRLEVTGPPIRLAEDVPAPGPGEARFAASGGGSVAYRSGDITEATRLTWVDRAGTRVGTVDVDGAWEDLHVSPAGRRVAATKRTIEGRDVWVVDLDRGTASRLTSSLDAASPVWSPDGERLAFTMALDTPPNVFVAPAHGAGEARRLTTSRHVHWPTGWSADGRSVVYMSTEPDGESSNLWLMPVEDGDPRPLLATKHDELWGVVSPNGRWLAYASDETGRDQIYVTGFPEPGRRWQISARGGSRPRWRRDGRELYYLAPDDRLMATPVETGGEFSVGQPKPLFSLADLFEGGERRARGYDPAPDGQRFLFALETGTATEAPIEVVLNWTELVER